jgi:hypothetical protein
MTKDWYLAGRIQEQIQSYRDARARNQAASSQLWWVAFAGGLLAIVFGAAGIASAPRFAPWIGAATTVAAPIAAYGLIDRRKYLIASYAAMQSSLEQILGLDKEAPMSVANLVTTTKTCSTASTRRGCRRCSACSTNFPQRRRAPPEPSPGKTSGTAAAGSRQGDHIQAMRRKLHCFPASGFSPSR